MSTYTPLGSVTLASDTAKVIFGAINQSYTDLVVVVSGQSDLAGSSTNGLRIRFNSDDDVTTTNYSDTFFDATNTTVSASQTSNQGYFTPGSLVQTSAAYRPLVIFNINNYSNSTTLKTVLSRNSESGALWSTAHLWRNTAPITSIILYRFAGQNLKAGSTFNLYGISSASSAQAKATGGNTIITDSTYWYHVFTTSGTFTPTQNITADVLQIAGGGSGGPSFADYTGAGGGGAGGVSYVSAQSLSANNPFTVTVGAGGAGTSSTSATWAGISGSNSQFGSLTAAVGGGTSNFTGIAGGSGGGTAGGAGLTNGGNGTAGQGNKGGGADQNAGAGGGGAGAVGTNASSQVNAGAGGIGTSSFSSWGLATRTGQLSGGIFYYAGGGGGGGGAAYGTPVTAQGGLGGGGAGGDGGNDVDVPQNGLANTGGGGGACGMVAATGTYRRSGSGGSGIVIVRYAV